MYSIECYFFLKPHYRLPSADHPPHGSDPVCSAFQCIPPRVSEAFTKMLPDPASKCFMWLSINDRKSLSKTQPIAPQFKSCIPLC